LKKNKGKDIIAGKWRNYERGELSPQSASHLGGIAYRYRESLGRPARTMKSEDKNQGEVRELLSFWFGKKKRECKQVKAGGGAARMRVESTGAFPKEE